MYEKVKEAIEKHEEIAKAVKKTKDLYKNNKEAIKAAETALSVSDALEELTGISPDQLTTADMTRIMASVAAIFDPTGIFGVVASFSHPKCSTIFND